MNDTLKTDLQAVADKNQTSFSVTIETPEIPEVSAVPAVPASSETLQFIPSIINTA